MDRELLEETSASETIFKTLITVTGLDLTIGIGEQGREDHRHLGKELGTDGGGGALQEAVQVRVSHFSPSRGEDAGRNPQRSGEEPKRQKTAEEVGERG